MRGLLLDTCVQYINLTALIPKLNQQNLLLFEEEKDVTNPTLRQYDSVTRLLQCIGRKKDGRKKLITALEGETSHKGHVTLLAELKRVPLGM